MLSYPLKVSDGSSFWYQSLGVVNPKDKEHPCVQRALPTRLWLIKLMSGMGHELTCAWVMKMLHQEESIAVNRVLENNVVWLDSLDGMLV